MTDLKPCPFCGSGRAHVTFDVDSWASVHCPECRFNGPDFNHSASAIAAWNRRAPAPSAEGDYDDLKKLRRLACRAWRHDLTRQQALDALKLLQNAAQDSYTPDKHMTDALDTTTTHRDTAAEGRVWVTEPMCECGHPKSDHAQLLGCYAGCKCTSYRPAKCAEEECEYGCSDYITDEGVYRAYLPKGGLFFKPCPRCNSGKQAGEGE